VSVSENQNPKIEKPASESAGEPTPGYAENLRPKSKSAYDAEAARPRRQFDIS
jgi:hypothetical protein